MVKHQHNQTKYQSLALWLCAKYGIVCPNLRDSFTAGGKSALIVNNKRVCAQAPRVLINLLKNMPQIKRIFKEKIGAYNEIPFYASYAKTPQSSYYATWRKLVVKNLSDTIGSSMFPLNDIFDWKFIGEANKQVILEMK